MSKKSAAQKWHEQIAQQLFAYGAMCEALGRRAATRKHCDDKAAELLALLKPIEGAVAEPFYYGVLDVEGHVDYCAAWPEACHEHINAMLMMDEPPEEYKGAKVIPLYTTAPPRRNNG